MTRRLPAVFLDRDGVINEVRIADGVVKPPLDVADVIIAPGARQALGRLRSHGFVLVCVTNQPDVASGEVTREVVDAINTALSAQLGLDAVYVCPHQTADGCACRKPKPGMLFDASDDLSLDLTASWSIGDRWVDVAAGRRAGVRSILLERPYSWDATSSGSPPEDLRDIATAADLTACVEQIIGPPP